MAESTITHVSVTDALDSLASYLAGRNRSRDNDERENLIHILTATAAMLQADLVLEKYYDSCG